ncbi:MAG: DOMON-like domain-containing protein [Gammaproteobacteria bacterium]|nr:DOMON-like domain-containing protein [Gammaproteobacteria bacterium]
MQLFPHPDEPGGPVQRFMAEAARAADGALHLVWRLQAAPGAIRLPAATVPERRDGLWRHTCFEAFVAAPRAAGYLEFNFAPSGHWAAYAFTGYRDGMTSLALPVPPRAHWISGEGSIALEVTLPAVPGAGRVEVGLCAVVEDSSGRVSHWALRHPAGAADFHHREGFVLKLPGRAGGAASP